MKVNRPIVLITKQTVSEVIVKNGNAPTTDST